MKSALVIVDVQQALVEALEAPRRAALLATINGLLRRARATRIPVIYIRHQDEELVADTPGWDIAAEIAPAKGDHIVEKSFRDAFRDTDLKKVLKRLRVEHLVVCGMQTEFCVDATIREAERRGFTVTLVADGHATYDAGGLTEEQIREHVHRVAADRVAGIAPASSIFSSN